MGQYPTTDLPVKDMPAVNSAVLRLLDRWIFPFMGMVYNFKPASFVVQVRLAARMEQQRALSPFPRLTGRRRTCSSSSTRPWARRTWRLTATAPY